uniref:sphingomyelin phosphodiesterase n=1 Tax=Plectus sambesii TaxID=2011161 RepID=A0A914XM65_9BILA
MDVVLRVLTLNCWALPQPWPIGSKHRSYRLAKLAEALAAGTYDIVALQELWDESDFVKIKDAVRSTLPFSHYYHSGLTGSGVCILSRFPIVSTLMHRYSLNGYAHHIHRGDWFGGKVVGMAEVEIGDLNINVYSTHLHAEYDKENDLYLPHRLCQAFELSQFVKHTAKGAHLSLVTGDFNMEPSDLGYRVILCNAKVKDAWTMRSTSADDDTGATCERPDNIYTPKSMLKLCPDGKRLDYIMYRKGHADIELVKCENRLNRISENEDDVNYSDHIAVYAEFQIKTMGRRSSMNSSATKEECEPAAPLLGKAIQILENGERRAKWDRRFYVAIIVVLATIFIASVNVEIHFPAWAIPALITRVLLTLIIGFCVWYGFFGLTMEEKALKAAKLSMVQLLNDTT